MHSQKRPLLAFIIPLAGKSSRMGIDKFSLRKNGHYWLEILIHEMRGAAKAQEIESKIILVSSDKKKEPLERILHESGIEFHSADEQPQNTAHTRGHNQREGQHANPDARSIVELIFNRDSESELWHSIKLGFEKALKESADLAFVSPVDCPVKTEILIAMLRAYKSLPLVPVYQGRKGHPVLIEKKMMERFLQRPGRFDEFLSFSEINFFETDQSIVTMNMNSPSDWQNFIESSEPEMT